MKDVCYNEFVVNGNLFHGPCISFIISKLLGFAIILGSLIVKVPQILKILNAKSAKGINLGSSLLELAGLLLTLSYAYRMGFPFSTYGETAFISVQNVIIVFEIFYFSGGLTPLFFGIMATYATAVYVFLFNPANILDISVLGSLQTFNIVILIFARIPQIWTSFSNKSAGQLAFLTWLLNFAGATARVFTTMQETGDVTQMVVYVLSSVLNGTVLFQILYYGNEKETKKEVKHDSKKKK